MLDALTPVLAPVLGWSGTVGTLAAYALIQRGTVHARSPRYLLLNGIGGLAAAAGAALYEAWPSAVANVIWAGFALHGLIVLLSGRRRAEAELPAADLVVPDDTSALIVIPGPQPEVVVVPDDTSALEVITPEAAEAARRAAQTKSAT